MMDRPIIFGEILFDIFPDSSQVLGGAPLNVAWHLQAFGARPLFISRTGQDAAGDHARRTLTDWGLDTQGIQTDLERPTGRVEITITQGQPHYTIPPGVAFDAITAQDFPPIRAAAVLYHGSLALRQGGNRHSLDVLRRLSGAPIFLDVNLRAPWWTHNDVMAWVQSARWVKLNAEELNILSPGPEPLAEKAKKWVATYDLDWLVITLGEEGSCAIDKYERLITLPPPPASPIVDTVGAGDAFSAVLILGIIRGWSLEFSLRQAQDFASRIICQRGATSPRPEIYHGFDGSF